MLFSIRDPLNRPVGLGGRVLPESGSTSPAKYVNSPETPLFAKSSLLYGLDVARDAMRKSRTALVMEGYTDCIVAHQYGFANAVAMLGTALDEHHIRNLKHFVDKIVLVLDGDAAGKRRTNEVLELFVAREADLRILTLPEEMDPAEFLRSLRRRRPGEPAVDPRGGRPGPCLPDGNRRARRPARPGRGSPGRGAAAGGDRQGARRRATGSRPNGRTGSGW